VAVVERLSVGVYDKPEALRAAIDDELARLPNLRVSLQEEWHGRTLYLAVAADGDEGEVRTHLALALAEHILSDLEPRLLARLVGRHYGFFDEEERASILAYAGRNLAGSSDAEALVHRKAKILARLSDYLEGEHEVNLEGFIRFRLKDYVEELEDAVDRAIDDFLLEKEYREFVRLLRYFVDVQEPRMGVAHVVFGRDGSFRIFDERAEEVEDEALRRFVLETLDSDVAYEDLLVSALITLAPRQVKVHDRFHRADPESVETVAEVFEGRVEFCDGCGFCRLRSVQGRPLH
jgi:putative sporulation protein YtxC